MQQIILSKYDDGSIRVISDEDQLGTESYFKRIADEKEQFLIAITEFLGFEPAVLLNLDLGDGNKTNV